MKKQDLDPIFKPLSFSFCAAIQMGWSHGSNIYGRELSSSNLPLGLQNKLLLPFEVIFYLMS